MISHQFAVLCHQGLRTGNVTLSQRFEQFKKEELLKLPSSRTQHAEQAVAPSSLGAWAGSNSDPWPELKLKTEPEWEVALRDPEWQQPVDADPWDDWDVHEDVQVVPDQDSRSALRYSAPRRPSTAGREYSGLPNQPTIRSFFKATPRDEQRPAPPPSEVTSSGTSGAQPPLSELDDSWDLDILMAGAGDSFVPCKECTVLRSETRAMPSIHMARRARLIRIHIAVLVDRIWQ